ncbi:MAG: HNH endonuclease [Actinobacteria bacterium]|nr:HNH endonuclease [Actinomycetota bacterium]
MADADAAVRLAAFEFLDELTQVHGDALPRNALSAGFPFEGRRVPLLGPQGIFKPAVMSDMPLSITTTPIVEGKTRPYEDQVTDDGFIAYRYRGTDPGHHENVGLRRALKSQTPLIYFYGLVPGQYAASWPVYIVNDDPRSLTFTIAVDMPEAVLAQPTSELDRAFERRYATRMQLVRLHQASFRQRVIRAYREACAICRLRHQELLDAAHILPDTSGGDPSVTNGLALCKLHHAAFDRNIMGIRPDLVVEISTALLNEIDGPMLVHGLQGFHGSSLIVPQAVAQQPDRAFLEERYEVFREVG